MNVGAEVRHRLCVLGGCKDGDPFFFTHLFSFKRVQVRLSYY